MGGLEGGDLWIAGLVLRGFVKKRSFTTSSFRCSWFVELHRNLMFAASYVVIVIWERLSMDF